MERTYIPVILLGALVTLAAFGEDATDAATTPTANEANEKPDRITITTISGTAYERCKVTRVEPDGISVMYAKGIAKIPFTDLPESYRQEYGYDPARAEDYSRAAASARAAAWQRQQELAKRAKQRAEYEAAHRDAIEKIKESAIEIEGKVQQITDEGALVSDAVTPQRYQEEVVTPGFRPMDGNRRYVTKTRYLRIANEYEPIFVLGAGSGFTDGAGWKATVYPAGTYRYSTVMGAGKTVKCFALSPEGALDHLVGD